MYTYTESDLVVLFYYIEVKLVPPPHPIQRKNSLLYSVPVNKALITVHIYCMYTRIILQTEKYWQYI